MVTLYFLEIYINQIIPYVLVSVWFLAIVIIILSFTHVTVCLNDNSFHFIAQWYFIVWKYHTYLSINLFQLLCILLYMSLGGPMPSLFLSKNLEERG